MQGGRGTNMLSQRMARTMAWRRPSRFSLFSRARRPPRDAARARALGRRAKTAGASVALASSARARNSHGAPSSAAAENFSHRRARAIEGVGGTAEVADAEPTSSVGGEGAGRRRATSLSEVVARATAAVAGRTRPWTDVTGGCERQKGVPVYLPHARAVGRRIHIALVDPRRASLAIEAAHFGAQLVLLARAVKRSRPVTASAALLTRSLATRRRAVVCGHTRCAL